MQKLCTRLGAPDDFESLDLIRAAAFAPVFASFRSLVGAPIADIAFRYAEREQHDDLQRLLVSGEGRAVLVASANGAAVGFCAYTWKSETGIGEIGLNAVHPVTQRRASPYGFMPMHSSACVRRA